MTIAQIQRQAAEQAAAQMRAAGLNPVILANNTVVESSYLNRPAVTLPPTVDPFREPPPMVVIQPPNGETNIAPLISGTSEYVVAGTPPPALSSIPISSILDTTQQPTTSHDYDSGTEESLARKNGLSDGREAGENWRGWDDERKRERKPRKKAKRKKRKAKKR